MVGVVVVVGVEGAVVAEVVVANKEPLDCRLGGRAPRSGTLRIFRCPMKGANVCRLMMAMDVY